MTAAKIFVKGRVQGVGFRPFIFRLASELKLSGWVLNTNEGVTIWIEGKEGSLQQFSRNLKNQAPEAARLSSLKFRKENPEGYQGFEIRNSLNLSDEITEISPDIAVCDACLDDMTKQMHRLSYPLINCTHCGPRFTIIRDLPYDRPNTTMDMFPMCKVCEKEYKTVTDRRFHAQPVACNRCGPKYEAWEKGRKLTESVDEILHRAAGIINRGGILAIKGVGGFHLACDAFNQESVLLLRRRKGRETKPLAVMFKDHETAAKYVRISSREMASLLSWRRPIALLKSLEKATPALAPGLNEGLSTQGVLLPYMPFHYLLMDRVHTPAIVLTSGNFSEAPILIENSTALDQFTRLTDLVITHQREIYNRIDDSVVRIMAGKERVLRRARGYCPDPVTVKSDAEGIVAMGAELVNGFCMGKRNRAYLSQYIGDLKNPETQQFYQETIDRFIRLFRIDPGIIVTDLHPEYFSSKWGMELIDRLTGSGKQVGHETVQHHHAHIASCMAEHRLDERVIGVAFDGTGLGIDGHIWGSEFFVADLYGFERISHFEYLPMPGGDKAVEEPWRMALACLHQACGDDLDETEIPFLQKIGQTKREWIRQMIDKQVNTPLTCGAGRYFDAVAALLGLCYKSGYEGEGPMKLEALTQKGIRVEYPVEPGESVSWNPAIRAIVQDIRNGVDPVLIATKFHNSLILAIFETVSGIRNIHGLNKVILSGGVFQNRYLVEHLLKRLKENKFKVYIHAVVPPNDGGVALGQLVIAAKRREKYVFGNTR
ncbi:MAG: carbamoyltransferase HypF [Bacteroidales bacterium]|nr:carbamoyltransferase HypF [Bacteroidales bacterium]